MDRLVWSGMGRSVWTQAPEREISSRLARLRRVRPVLSFHWTSTMSEHNILGSTRLSTIQTVYRRGHFRGLRKPGVKIALWGCKAPHQGVPTRYPPPLD